MILDRMFLISAEICRFRIGCLWYLLDFCDFGLDFCDFCWSLVIFYRIFVILDRTFVISDGI